MSLTLRTQVGDRGAAGLLHLVTLLLASLLTVVHAQQALTVEQALALALQSPAVAVAELELASSERQLAVASGLVSGTISGGYRATAGERSAPSLPEPQSLDGASFDPFRLDLSFNVVPFGPSYDGIVSAEERVLQAELALRDARSEAVVDAVEQLLAALRAAQELEVTRFAVGMVRSEVVAAEVRVEAGTATGSQLTQARISLQQAENSVASAERALSQTLRILSATLGVPVTEVLPVDVAVAVPAGPILDEQLMQRSDVQRALLRLAQVERDAAAALRSALPTGSLGLSYSLATDSHSFELGASFDSSSFQPSLSGSFDVDSGGSGGVSDAVSSSVGVSLGVRIPLDSGLGDALALTELARQQALLAFDQTLTTARLALLLSADQVASNEAAVALAGAQLAQAQTAVEVAQQRFDLGVVSQLEVLAAERTVREQRLRYDRTRDSLLLAQLSLLRASALDPLEVF